MNYRENRAWSDRFIPRMRELIGPHLLAPSSLDQDTKQAVDLVVLRGRDMSVACRVRRPGFADKYPRQFTLRSKLDSGVMTEFRKVVYGWGDWLFYGHATADELDIYPWWLIDLSAFRAHLIAEVYGKRIRQGSEDNHDGTRFQWFDIDSFPAEPPLLIAESEPALVAVAKAGRQARATCKHNAEYKKDGQCWICQRMAG